MHERDKLCDFLLIALRQALIKYNNLKVILMSATLNIKLFVDYFSNCPVIQGKVSIGDNELEQLATSFSPNLILLYIPVSFHRNTFMGSSSTRFFLKKDCPGSLTMNCRFL